MELRIIVVWMALLALNGCGGAELSDAYGQFEADETMVSAELSGKLLSFTLAEGMEIPAGRVVGLIDTTSLVLKRKELEAGIQSVRSRLSTLEAQSGVYREQLKTARKDLDRLLAMKADGAATRKQIDDATGAVHTLEKQVAATESQKESVYAEVNTLKVRIEQVNDQLNKARIVNPVSGTVLTKFAEPYELTMQGKPLYRIADTRELMLRVYVSGAQLPGIILGEQVEVLIDKNKDEVQALSGVVSWISEEAEFTPKMIQTREERVTQMYAVKVRVSNPEGLIKIGMPGEVNF